MTSNVYQSWLMARGISSPGGQPFQLFASHIDPQGSTLVVATSNSDDASAVVMAVSRLAGALSQIQTVDAGGVSWLVAHEAMPLPTFDLLRSLCPSMVRWVDLTGSHQAAVDAEDIFVISGPKMAVMNQDAAVKKSFWITLQQWMSEPVDSKLS